MLKKRLETTSILLWGCRAFVFLQALRHPPIVQIITGTQRQPLHILEPFTIRGRFFLVKQECNRLFIVDDLLPAPVQLFSLFKIELQASLFEQVVRFGIFEVKEIRSARRGAGMPQLIGIRRREITMRKVKRARIESVVL